MIKINDSHPVKGYSHLKKKLKSASSGAASFDSVLSAASSTQESLAGVSGLSGAASVGSLLALQEVSQEEMAKKEALQHGTNLLKSLEALRQSLLLGRVPVDVLRTLESRLQRQRQLTMDPELHEIIDDIELRAAVELAKYDSRRV